MNLRPHGRQLGSLTAEPRQVLQLLFIYFYFLFIYFFVLAISWATPAAYGSSQARGQIGAAATSLRQSQSNTGSEPCLQPTPQLNGNTGSSTH